MTFHRPDVTLPNQTSPQTGDGVPTPKVFTNPDVKARMPRHALVTVPEGLQVPNPLLAPPEPPSYFRGGRHLSTIDRAAARALPRGYNFIPDRRMRDYEHGANHNHVDISNITNGVDVRTTVSTFGFLLEQSLTSIFQIMLRNIPNSVDQTQLKAVLDQTSQGMYDFMYLRIGLFSSPLDLAVADFNRFRQQQECWIRFHQLCRGRSILSFCIIDTDP